MEENKKVIITGAVAICLIALALIIYFMFIKGGGKEAPAEAVPGPIEPAAETEPVINPDEAAVLVGLDESDDVIRNLAAALTSNPLLEKGLRTKDIARKFTASVDNIAGGQSPGPHVDFFKPEGKFTVMEKDGQIYIDPTGYRRYDVLAGAVDSLDAEACAGLLRRLLPVFDEAYKELGYPEGDFGRTLERALEVLLRTPIVETDLEVEPQLLSFKLADPQLEALSPAQKHLLRMGPENTRKIQAKLRQFGQALGLKNLPGSSPSAE